MAAHRQRLRACSAAAAMASLAAAAGCTLPDAEPGDPAAATASGSSSSASGGGQAGNGAGGATVSASSSGVGATGGTGNGGSGGQACVVAQVTARGDHSCARSAGGDVWCWGSNELGEVGQGTTASPQPTPQPVAPLAGVVSEVEAGGRHTCARKSDGTVWCWGSTEHGQVGNGAVGLPEPTPSQVTLDGPPVVEIAMGFDHACARKEGNTLWCWGRNEDGQVGNGSMTTPQALPVQVTALGSTVVAVSGGTSHTCALKGDKSVWCWGENSDGQLGDGGVQPSPSPVPVATLGNTVVAIAAGGYHSCAIKQDGTLWCWGKNTSGQIGTGDTTTPQPLPVKVMDFQTTAADVWAGPLNTCVRKTDNSLWCWGNNVNGQVGDGTTDSPKVDPVLVAKLGMTVAEAAAGYHTCARQAAGGVWCWGKNDAGQLGDGTTDSEPQPLEVALPCP